MRSTPRCCWAAGRLHMWSASGSSDTPCLFRFLGTYKMMLYLTRMSKTDVFWTFTCKESMASVHMNGHNRFPVTHGQNQNSKRKLLPACTYRSNSPHSLLTAPEPTGLSAQCSVRTQSLGLWDTICSHTAVRCCFQGDSGSCCFYN